MNKILNLISILFSILFFTVCAHAQINISTCQTISSEGTYILQNDVSSIGTCFLIASDNVTLNLNGHTIRYADRTSEPIIPNAGFEYGSGSQAENWNLENAPDASRTNLLPQIRDKWVRDEVQNYAMKFSSPMGEQYIYSDPVPNIQAGTIHILSTLLHRHKDVANIVKAWVISNSGEELCGTSWHTDPNIADRSNFWSGNDCAFNPQVSDLPIRIKIGVKQGFSGNVYFDAIEIKPGNDYIYENTNVGISQMVGIRAGSDNQPPKDYIRVTNGNIIQGNGKAYFTRAIFLTGRHIEVDNVKITAYGPDSSGIYLGYPNDFNVHDNEITLNGERTHFSHAAFSGAIQVTGYGGENYQNLIYNNIVHRSPGLGIKCSRRRTDIYNNRINIEASSIHSYGIYPNRDSRVFRNIIRNNYGSGIFLQGLDNGSGTSADVTNTEVFNNYVEVRDCPHEDFEWTGKALWTRYRVGNLNIHDNTFIGYAGVNYPLSGLNSAMSTVRLGGNDDSRGPIYFKNNVVEAYTNDTDVTYFHDGEPNIEPTYAVALGMNVDSVTGITKYIENNTLKSNHIVLLFGGDYAPGNKAKLKDNIFEKASAPGFPITDNFSTILIGRNKSVENEIIDSLGQAGADVHDIDLDANYNDVELDLKFTLVTLLKGSDGRCIQGVTVTISNSSPYFSAVTETSGNGGAVISILLDRRVRNQNQVPNDVTLPEYTVRATYNGRIKTTSVTMDTRKEISILFDDLNGNVDCDAGPDWNPGGSGFGGDPGNENTPPSAPTNLRIL